MIYVKAAHPSLVNHRDGSPFWIRTRVKSKHRHTAGSSSFGRWVENLDRDTASHRYIGPAIESRPSVGEAMTPDQEKRRSA